jgi:hypothetical protein
MTKDARILLCSPGNAGAHGMSGRSGSPNGVP